jgi:hypothetical protein
METLFSVLRDFVAAIRAINQKYRTPRIVMTPMVKLSLLMLRFYLIAMVLLLAYKFVTIVSGQ